MIKRLKEITNVEHKKLYLSKRLKVEFENILKKDHVKCFYFLVSNPFYMNLIEESFQMSNRKINLIHYCCKYYSLKCLKYIEKSKQINLNWNLKSSYIHNHESPIEWAFKMKSSYQQKEQLLSILLRNDFNINDYQILFKAACVNFEWVEILILSNGSDINNILNSEGDTLLFYAIKRFDATQKFDFLFGNFFDISDNYNTSQEDERNRFIPIIKTLLKLGADPNIKHKKYNKSPKEISSSPHLQKIFQLHDLICELKNLWYLE